MASSRRMRSRNVALAITTVVAASTLTACGSETHQGICVDPETQVRVDDDECDDVDDDAYYGDGSSYAHYWFFIAPGKSAPAVGSSYSTSSGAFKAPSGASVSKGGFSSKGGTVKAGGFGSGFGKASS